MPNRTCVSFLLLVAACGTVGPVSEQQFLHSLTVTPSGAPWELDIKPGPLGQKTTAGLSFDAQLQIIKAQPEWKKKKRILLFIHGGLNSIANGLARTERLVPAILKDSNEETYPILINWRSGVLSGYQDHLFKYHNGEKKSSFWRGVASPVVLLADIGRSFARLPIVYWDQGYAAVKRAFSPAVGAEVPEGWRDRVRLDPRPPHWSMGTRIFDGVTEFLPGIVRIVTTPVIDTIGFEGYDMILRRIDTLFFTNEDLQSRTKEPHGALYRLMQNIPVETEIVLIGHSMGTIALNELIRRFPNHNYSHIVYMAAACTIKDFMDAVPDYIAHNLERKQTTEFHNLCLHPAADESEVSLWSTVPNGSLLEWLDAFLLGPRTPMYRTLGKWNNAVRMLPLFQDIPQEVLDCIHMRGFTVQGDDYPAKHGDFDDFCFWRPDFWEPTNVSRTEKVAELLARVR